jgi:DMSO/TMAO reductase YedYZ molybdopterin-dependent catalytic subunit
MVSDQQQTTESSPLMALSEDPFCRESLLTSLDSWITPTDRFYIRNHFSKVPDIDPSDWRLSIEGLVKTPLSISLSDLQDLPSKDMVITLECAGNSRSQMTPPAEGLKFGQGGVSTARWTGVPLASLLDNAVMKNGAKEVLFLGADTGTEEEDGAVFSHNLPYERSLSLADALNPDTLLVYKMNGEPLTRHHGSPVRLVVPGWYGMASVKWLTKVEVIDYAFDGFFQRRRYVFINEGPDNNLYREPVATLRVKSLINSPRHGTVIHRGNCTIGGFAWSGDGAIAKVEVSTDGGDTWKDARLVGQLNEHAWRRWEIQWDATHSGHFIVMARATDAAGNTQPQNVPWNFRGYANNSIHTIAVEVTSSNRPPPP